MYMVAIFQLSPLILLKIVTYDVVGVEEKKDEGNKTRTNLIQTTLNLKSNQFDNKIRKLIKLN